MKRLVTVTERHTYEVDVDDLLIRLTRGLSGDGWGLGDFARCGVEVEVVLVEIEESGTECCGKAATDSKGTDA